MEQLRRWGVGLRSYSEPWLDTSGTSPIGDLMLNILTSFAQFERSLISERVRAGVQRAKKQGRRLGRPRVINEEWACVRPLIESGELSQAAAARRLRVSQATVSRLCKMGVGSGTAPGLVK